MPFFPAIAQDDKPSVSPKATYTHSKYGYQEVTSIDDGEAPLEVTFYANPSNMEDYTPAYEWHFRRKGDEGEMMVRYEENTTYRFVESGTFEITLKVKLTDSDIEVDSATISIVISESQLDFPNAFSPNNDGPNDIFHAKEGYKSIVEFHAYIFNRWGQKLYEWTDLAGGWDGNYKGNPVKEGVYFLLVKAKGADGKVYNIRKDVNLLRGYSKDKTNTSDN